MIWAAQKFIFKLEQESNSSGDRIPERRTWHRSILLPVLRLTPPMEGLSRVDLRKILHGGQR